MLSNRSGSTWNHIDVPSPVGRHHSEANGGRKYLSFLENGVERIAGYDPTYTGGDPGMMVNGYGTVGNWSGGTAGFEVHYLKI
jgi:hypothetical protein